MKFILLASCIFGLNLSTFSQDLQWVKRLDTKSTASMYAPRIKRDAQNNIIMVGLFRDTVDFDLGTGVFKLTPSGGPNLDIFIAKYSPTGNFMWAKKIAGHDWVSFNDFTIDKNSNIIISALMNDIVDVNPSNAVKNIGIVGKRTAFIAKYNSSGNFSWVKTYGETANISRLACDAQGKIIAAGNFYGTVDFNPGTPTLNITAPGNTTHLFITRLNASGSFSWVKRMGDATNFSVDVYDVQVDASNAIYVGGRFNGLLDFNPATAVNTLNSSGKYVGYYAKYSSTGNYVFAKAFNCSGNSMVNNIRIDGTGRVVLTGKFIGTLDLDASNAALNVSASAAYDIFVTQYSATGNLVWGFDLGNVSEEVLTNHEVSANGNTYIFGRFKGTIDVNPSTVVTNLVSAPASQSDLFFLEYNASGALVSSKKLGNNKVETPACFTLSTSGELLLFGTFNGTVDFDFSSATSNLTATESDYFLATYQLATPFAKKGDEEVAQVAPIEEDKPSINKISHLELYPNPVLHELYVGLKQGNAIESIKIYNIQGVLVYDHKQAIGSEFTPLSLEFLTSGMYVLLVNDQYTQSFMKQ